MRVLVTGGAGFIGSGVVARLSNEGHEVVVLDDLSTGYAENVAADVELVEGSVVDRRTVENAIEGCTGVVHLAAARAVLLSVEHPLETNRVNVEGSLNVLVAARDAGVQRVVMASSSSVYGGEADLPTPEGASLEPKSPYAVSKLAAEHYARTFWTLYGLETVSLRFFNVFGPRQRPDSQYAAVIPLFIDALRHGLSPTIHGDGRQSRDFTYIDNVVDAVVLSLTGDPARVAGQIFNIAAGEQHTLLDLLGALEAMIGASPAHEHLPPRPGDVRHSQADIARARNVLGYEPEVGFAEGLHRTLDWTSTRE